ncbi:MAG: PhnD/SsuA/transferrin family substrate-binding protein [Clostridia bacterium]|nr:PhnD/SsuA/transferrin family substrate-binding protein [Clostridia bacterium]
MSRKIISLIVILCLALLPAALAEPIANVGALKGPTAMGMVGMMRDNADSYSFTLAAAPDEVVPLLVKGELDIAAVPANLGAVLYNNTQGAVKALAINTLGVLYIVERGDTVHALEDLKGRTLVTAGKGSTPEYALNALLRGAGLDPESDVTIEFKSEHAECLAAMLNDETLVAMLPQPFATVAQTKADDLRIALDLTAEWDAQQAQSENPSAMITGIVVARADFVESNPEAVSQFMADYAASVAFVQSDVPGAAQLIGEFDIFEAGPAEKALPYCNIVFIDGEEMHGLLGGYLAELFAQDPASVGGALPDESFYY